MSKHSRPVIRRKRIRIPDRGWLVSPPQASKKKVDPPQLSLRTLILVDNSRKMSGEYYLQGYDLLKKSE